MHARLCADTVALVGVPGIFRRASRAPLAVTDMAQHFEVIIVVAFIAPQLLTSRNDVVATASIYARDANY